MSEEGGHFYTVHGEPKHSVPYKGGVRRTTLHDARRLGLLPSVTTIMRAESSPQLEAWKRQRVVEAAFRVAKEGGLDAGSTAFGVAVAEAAFDDTAARHGTEIHGAVEALLSGARPKEWAMHSQIALDVLGAVVGPLERLQSERSLASRDLGYAGQIDIHSDEWVIDIKTKTAEAGGTMRCALYDNHYMQLAAYRRLLEVEPPSASSIGDRPRRRCGILFVSRDAPDAVFVEAAQHNIDRGERMFSALLDFWRAKHEFPQRWQF